MSLQLAHSDEPNLAPAAALAPSMERRAQDRTVEVEPDWFKNQKKALEQEDKETWDNESLKWALVMNFIEGRQLLKRAKYGHGWRPAPLPDRTDIPVYGFNLTGFYSEGIKSKWTQSTTDVMWRPSRETDDAIGASKAGTAVHEHYQRKLYTQSFRQMEALLAQCGKYARVYYYSDEAKGYARRPRVEERSIQLGESAYFCPDCGSSGILGSGGTGSEIAGSAVYGTVESDASGAGMDLAPPASAPFFNSGNAAMANAPGGLNDFQGSIPADLVAISDTPAPSDAPGYDSGDMSGLEGGAGADEMDFQAPRPTICPACGSPNIEVEQSEPFNVEAITGYDEIETGDIVCEDVPAFELKHDLGKLPQDSPYLIRRRRIRLPLLQSKFPYLHITQSKGDNRGVQLAESLKRTSAGGGSMWSKDAQEEPATDFVQIWLDPCMYSQLVLKSDMATLSGETIPAGTKLVDLFPKGIYMCFIEGIDGVVELRNEHHKDYWVGQVYRQRAISALGQGIEDIVEGNRQYNLIMSIIYTQLRTSAMPATLFDERLLPNGTSAYLGSLSNVPVNLSSMEDKRLQDAVFQLSPQPPTAQHFGYADKLNNYMQLASRVTEFSGGLPGVDNDTATGAEITQAAAQSLFGPQLALKAEVDRCGAEIILELFKTYCIDEVWISLAGKRGQQDGMWLKAADIGKDLYAEVVPDSYLPQTNLERRQRWDAFLQRVGGLPGLKAALQEFPEQVEQLAEIFDVDLASADYTAAAEICRLRIEQMREAIPMLQMAMQDMPPVQMAADPMAEAGQFLLGILDPPIEIEETGQLSAIAYCRNFLTTDEGREAPPELRAGVKAMIYRYLEGVMAEAQFTGMLAMAGQPVMDAGQESPKSGEKNKNKQSDQMKPAGAQPMAAGVGA